MEESPTERSVRPSGDIEAKHRCQGLMTSMGLMRAIRTVVDWDIQTHTTDLLQLRWDLGSDRNVEELDCAVVVAYSDSRFRTAFVGAR